MAGIPIRTLPPLELTEPQVSAVSRAFNALQAANDGQLTPDEHIAVLAVLGAWRAAEPRELPEPPPDMFPDPVPGATSWEGAYPVMTDETAISILNQILWEAEFVRAAISEAAGEGPQRILAVTVKDVLLSFQENCWADQGEGGAHRGDLIHLNRAWAYLGQPQFCDDLDEVLGLPPDDPGGPEDTGSPQATGEPADRTARLDARVLQAAVALTAAYGKEVDIRYNDDHDAGGAWLLTPDGRNADVGISVTLVTAGTRGGWEQLAAAYKTRDGDDTESCWRQALDASPEGTLTVSAYIAGAAVRDPQMAAELAHLDGWQGREVTGIRGGYHHGPAEDITVALDRCLRFIPPEAAR